jgi:hypothetical protein
MESHAGNANHGAKMTINAVMLDRPTKDAVSLTVDADAVTSSSRSARC